MSNIINSQIPNINNTIPAYDISMGRKKSVSYIQAPDTLPSVTADSIIRQCDEFRKTVTTNQNLEMLPKVRKSHTKLKIFLAALAACALFALKKK